ncbi:MAG: multicomponent Na+:H+ antiporter subunit [Solirubrobacteraceae bacterium]|nr:multicomponent Na+:H+ antiporter subunit [Solirubrobacteraceae bacterium]
MTERGRRAIALCALAVMGAGLVAAVLRLPGITDPHGPYATAAVRLMLSERHVTNVVTGITFDLRGIDTLGEELILFSAAVGSTLLLRVQRDERRVEEARSRADERRERTPVSVRALGAALVGPVLLLGLYVIAHGPLTPGGGFQGGVLLAAALLGAYAAGQLIALERVRPIPLVELAEAVGAGAYVLVAVGGLVFASAAMASFLAPGSQGSLLSGGTIPVLNIAVGLEVGSAITLILTEFVDQALLRRTGER